MSEAWMLNPKMDVGEVQYTPEEIAEMLGRPPVTENPWAKRLRELQAPNKPMDDGAGELPADSVMPDVRPPLRVLRYVAPHLFRREHLPVLDRLCANGWDGTTTRQLAQRIYIGDLWLFEAIEPLAIVLLSTAQLDNNITGELVIEGIAGDGVIARADEIADDLRTIARQYNSSRITAVTPRTGWEPLGERLGFTPKATIWHLEVNYGRSAEEH